MQGPQRTTTMLTADALAARWGVHVKTILGVIRAGRLTALRFGRIYRIPLAAVEAFEAQGGRIAPTGEQVPVNARPEEG